MKWKDCGYLSLTKKGGSLKVVVKHQTYFVKLDEAKAVLNGEKNYTLVYEPIEEAEKDAVPQVQP